ncbi:MAG: Nitrilase/cyanide hydratase and apolipoprotein N-acyltransferase [Bacteroidetes bacterium]|nr:Nitrilase/cyanide hydratase and apolipoprotein N-acyltransferase [Bacteroidota bacterium]
MRAVRIGTTAFLCEETPHTPAMNVDRAVDYVARAARGGADILCLPEMVTTANVPRELEYHAERFPGEFTRRFRQAARKHRINLIAPYLVRVGRALYNQATVIDRRGRIVGSYRKLQPTGEESRHVTMGNELPVFDLDIGRVAVMICMDIYFPEIPRIYAFKGAEILFWPTVSHGPTQESLRTQLTARAIDNSLIVVESNLAGHPPYAAYAGRYRPATARIIDHNGDVLAQTGRRHGVAIAAVDLDEVRLTSQCVLIREPDRMREDLQRITRLDFYSREYARLARRQKRYY